MKTATADANNHGADHAPYHVVASAQVLAQMDVDADAGLTTAEAARRQAMHGPNRLRSHAVRSRWRTLVDQLKSLLTLLLCIATAVSFVVGDYAEAVAIMAVIVINSAIGYIAERRAITSMEALRRLGVTTTTVRRDGKTVTVLAEELVPGDIVRLESGDVVTADLRLIDCAQLECDESLLTGESLPVRKLADPVDEDAPIAEQLNMMFKGTSITRGTGEGVVVAIGIATQLGQIAKLVEEAEDEITPLEQRLNRMSRQLMWVALAIAAIVLAIGVGSGRDTILMLKTGIALAIAAIPEGLPIVATLALARGMWRLARRNALVRRLSAVETLGSVTVIFTDKTGTLTENRMAVTHLVLDSGVVELSANLPRTNTGSETLVRRAARVCGYCNSAQLQNKSDATGVGDPMELALLAMAEKLTPSPDAAPKVGEFPFDPDRRMMATIHRFADDVVALVKGAPEAVLACATSLATADGNKPLTDAQRDEWLSTTQQYAADGLRVLALADRTMSAADAPPYEDLTLLGLVILHDPPRADAGPAMAAARAAGIKITMITGDNAVTAASIARLVGLADVDVGLVVEGKDVGELATLSQQEKSRLLGTRIFARVSPKQKLDLIALFQEAGEIVAMTGDGVNDAPALKKADIGIAMGQRGAPVAKEASDLVLKDDSFASIVAAIHNGRIIFDNIRKFVIYLLSCNLSEVLVVALSTASGLPLPLMPLQILFLNLVTDVFPALALGFGEGDDSVLNRPPRDPREPIVSRRHWVAVGLHGTALTTAVMIAFIWALQQPNRDPHYPVTVAFLTLALAQMWHVFNMRNRVSSVWNNQITRNPYVWGALVLCAALTLGAVYIPAAASVLSLVEPDARTWGVILSASLAPLLIGHLVKAVTVRRPVAVKGI